MRSIFFTILFFYLAFTVQNVFGQKINIPVAADCSSDVKSVKEAINTVLENNKKRGTIQINPGVYLEQIKIPATKPYISFLRENSATTILSFKISANETSSTSAAFAYYIAGHDFYANNIAFENPFASKSQQAFTAGLSIRPIRSLTNIRNGW